MRFLYSLSAILCGLILITSCKTNTELGSSSLVQKRRYTKGYHVNLKNTGKTDLAKVEREKTFLTPVEKKGNDVFASSDENMVKRELTVKTRLFGFSTKTTSKQEKALRKLNKKIEAKLNSKDSDFVTSKSFYRPSSMASSDAPNTDMNLVLLVILTILIPPLGIGLAFGIGTEFWISLVLTLLFYFPGLIYSLIILLR